MNAFRRDLRSYAMGFALAAGLTAAAFAVVLTHRLSTGATRAAIVGLGAAQMIVHFRCFMHVGWRRARRDDLLLILFSALVILMMAGGSVMVLSNLHRRMM